MKSIFVIDDDESIGEIISELLSIEGYMVTNFITAKDSISKLKSDVPDLVLLDYFMPGESAEETIKKIRDNTNRDFPIILMSASMQAEKMSKILPVNEFVPKPFQRDVLLDAIERNIN